MSRDEEREFEIIYNTDTKALWFEIWRNGKRISCIASHVLAVSTVEGFGFTHPEAVQLVHNAYDRACGTASKK